jgi:hypothetical protein
MNNEKKIFANEISITEIGQVFKIAIGNVAYLFPSQSCIWCSLVKR